MGCSGTVLPFSGVMPPAGRCLTGESQDRCYTRPDYRDAWASGYIPLGDSHSEFCDGGDYSHGGHSHLLMMEETVMGHSSGAVGLLFSVPGPGHSWEGTFVLIFHSIHWLYISFDHSLTSRQYIHYVLSMIPCHCLCCLWEHHSLQCYIWLHTLLEEPNITGGDVVDLLLPAYD